MLYTVLQFDNKKRNVKLNFHSKYFVIKFIELSIDDDITDFNAVAIEKTYI